jgi:CRP-like cAMP-binding protein
MKRDWATIRLFHHLLDTTPAGVREEAAEALCAAARISTWRRNQPCWPSPEGSRVGCVLTGTIRKYAVRANGQRQIVDLLMPGDFIGLAPFDPCYLVEAVSDGTRIAVFRPDQLAVLREAHPALVGLIRDRAADAIRRLENHVLIQGRITASEKVGGYLAAMSRRIQRDRHGALVLPISRYDIADHLGLAVETVSRSMTLLKRRGMIGLQSPRHVEIRNAERLAEGAAY